ncbi:MAG: 50S ribosomal protein L21 [bacterium]|nr:50S ribosomal protein L21 [bacterium]
MSFAIIETGGKQYRVSEGSAIKIEKLSNTKEGASVSFDKIVLTDDGTKTVIGAPYISGASVKGEVIEEGRGKKIEVVKYKAKSRYFKLRGHRQPFMKVRILSI